MSLVDQFMPSFSKGGNGKLFRNTALCLTGVFALSVGTAMTGGVGFVPAATAVAGKWLSFVGTGFGNLYAGAKAVGSGLVPMGP